MCGIYGMASPGGAPLRHRDVLDRMGCSLRHRGPDSRGTVSHPHVAMGVERLRIVDPLPRADQPFVHPAGQIILACNGQIYNDVALRSRLADYPYRSRGDIEPLLPLYQRHGIDGLVQVDGMFGLAIWDERDRSLILARDRAGEKPLFYLHAAGEVWFASEIQALLLHPGIERDLDAGAVRDFLALGYVRQPRTMFARVRKVEAGTAVRFNRWGTQVVRYWDARALVGQSIREANGWEPSRDAEPEVLRSLLENAVIKQTRADVPIGVFLSGGIDSAILATLAARVRGPARTFTFTARFADATFDEGNTAQRLATTLGTVHREVQIGPESLKHALDECVRRIAEPLADPALLPTWSLARAARQDAGAVLSGEGADELFGGYPTYLGHEWAAAFQNLPPVARQLADLSTRRLPRMPGPVSLDRLLRQFAMYAELPWADRHAAWFGTGLPETGALAQDRLPVGDGGSIFSHESTPAHEDAPRAMLLDYETYLRDGLLTKVDRATMLAGLEARAPYLDPQVQEFALGLPLESRIRGFTTKALLKQAGLGWLPRWVVRRKKRGFSVPIGSLLNGGLADEVDRLLDPARLQSRPWLRPGRVGQLLSLHRTGRGRGRVDYTRPLWTIFILESWLEHWGASHDSG